MEEIVTIARTWLGTKFHHQGRKKGVGVDCIGLVVGVMQELGLHAPDRFDYGRYPHGGELQAALLDNLQSCEQVPGAVALFKIKNEPQHVGIISDIGIIHAYAQARKVVEHGLDEWWQQRLVGCYKILVP